MQVDDFVAQVRTLLFDPAPGMGWSDGELVDYLNEAQQATSFVKPDAYVLATESTWVQGIAQALPSGGIAVLDVVKNTVSGSAITQVDKALLEAADPNWASNTPVANAEHYAVDPRSPRRYYLYPPVVAGAQGTILYGAVPPTVVISDAIALADSYVPTLQDYVLHRAYLKPGPRADMAKSQLYKQSWGAALGLKSQAQILNSPKIADGTPT